MQKLPKISAETYEQMAREDRPAIVCMDELEAEQPEFVEAALKDVPNSDAIHALTWMSLMYEAVKRTVCEAG